MVIIINGKKIAVFVPAYKEEKLLFNVISRMPKFVDKIILVWDEPIIIELAKFQKLKNVELITRKNKHGIGSAIMLGINLSRKLEYDYFIIMAGNGKDDPKQINRFITYLQKEFDYVQGSRWLKEGDSINLPPLRYFIVKGLALMWSIVLGKKITEVTNGFRGFNMKIFSNDKIKWNLDIFSGYELEYYLNYAIIKERYSHIEIPVSKTYVKNVNHSKIKLSHSLQILSPIIFTPIYHKIFKNKTYKIICE